MSTDDPDPAPVAAAVPAPSHWAWMRLWALAHAVDDFYQGLVPAAVPFFVLQRHLDYVDASGLALAARSASATPCWSRSCSRCCSVRTGTGPCRSRCWSGW